MTYDGPAYFFLEVQTKDPSGEIYIADVEGNLVVKAVGRFAEPLKANEEYDIRFGSKGKPFRILLQNTTLVKENENGEPCLE